MATKKKTVRGKSPAAPRASRAKANHKRPIETYEHKGKERLNNPPVGLVTPDTDPDAGQKKKTYAYDPHLDPQLVWAGKAEHTSFDVPTVSLHVHERIDPRTIIEAVRKRNGNGQPVQGSLFEEERKEPLREAIEFYRHKHGWTNRLIAGDSLLVMNSLLEKEGMAGKVQMIYIDPPYGIRYGSNFQPFVNKRDVKDGKDEDLTAEPEQIRAFRDTWELGIHSYLTYLRDRLLLARELLSESGSIFVQISDENMHHVREMMDEVFGAGNFCGVIPFKKTSGQSSVLLANVFDFVVWYAKSKERVKFRTLYERKDPRDQVGLFYDHVELADGSRRRLTNKEVETLTVPAGAKVFQGSVLYSEGATEQGSYAIRLDGEEYHPPSNTHWKTNAEGMQRLLASKRVFLKGKTLRYVRYFDDFAYFPLTNAWTDTSFGGFVGDQAKIYVVQTYTKVIERCVLMTTDPGDLVFDPTCGSGTTAYVAEQWGRRWITCDTSRVAITLAKQRLMTAVFDYYELAHPEEGVGSGFKYKTVPHVTLKSIANNPDIKEGMTREEIDAAIMRHAPQETLYDQPFVDRKKVRVTGPFTVEAVPAPAVKSVEELLEGAPQVADASVARSGETLRQGEWRDELLRAGIRGKSGQYIRFARLEPLPGCRWLHADGETRPYDEGADQVREKGAAYSARRIVVSFGPEHAPLEQRQVAQAIEEAQTLVPKPKLIVFAAFQFDPEAARDIDETQWPGVTLLKAQMNADLLTEDLKKKRASNESFWLIGQPDVEVSSFEFLVFSESGRRLAEYGTFKKLSGLDSLEEIHRLGGQDLFLYALLSQGRDVWAYLADQEGWNFHPSERRRRSSPKQQAGIPPVSWNSARIVGGAGDIVRDLKEFGISDLDGCRRVVERLRRDRQIASGLETLARHLNFPISPPTKNWQLKTKNLHCVAVHGFDYYNTKTGGIESGGEDKIAVWLLDTDYDGRSLYPRQVFFPMAGEKEGWARLAKNLKAEIDEELIDAYRGTVSLPFALGAHKRIAVKIVDDRGIESLKVLELA